MGQGEIGICHSLRRESHPETVWRGACWDLMIGERMVKVSVAPTKCPTRCTTDFHRLPLKFRMTELIDITSKVCLQCVQTVSMTCFAALRPDK